MRRVMLFVAAASLFLAGVACSGTDDGGAIESPGSTTDTSADVEGTLGNTWEPESFSASAGDTVTWSWEGFHSVVADDDSFTSGDGESAGSFEHTFDAAGSFAYHCGVHGSSMSGTIVVS